MIRRRALLAASGASGGGGQGWAYELHLTPEWDLDFIYKVAYIYGDFSSLFSTLISILGNFGTGDESVSYIYEFPEEFIFTVDGVSISSASYSIGDSGRVMVSFGDNISGFVAADLIYLENLVI